MCIIKYVYIVLSPELSLKFKTKDNLPNRLGHNIWLIPQQVVTKKRHLITIRRKIM